MAVKQTESKGVARGRAVFTIAINPWPPALHIIIVAMSHLIGPLLLLL